MFLKITHLVGHSSAFLQLRDQVVWLFRNRRYGQYVIKVIVVHRYLREICRPLSLQFSSLYVKRGLHVSDLKCSSWSLRSARL